jgi:hypothetical protein
LTVAVCDAPAVTVTVRGGPALTVAAIVWEIAPDVTVSDCPPRVLPNAQRVVACPFASVCAEPGLTLPPPLAIPNVTAWPERALPFDAATVTVTVAVSPARPVTVLPETTEIWLGVLGSVLLSHAATNTNAAIANARVAAIGRIIRMVSSR